jgi:hypothetical protein
MTEYTVVPKAVRDGSTAFGTAANKWSGFYRSTKNGPGGADHQSVWRLGMSDLGVLGRMSGVIDEYNSAVNTIATKANDSATALNQARDALNVVATEYEKQDYSAYERFGYTRPNP